MENRYKIEWKGKTAISRGASCDEAIKRFGDRLVFGGNTIFFDPVLKMEDAETRGEMWAVYKDKDSDQSDFRIDVTRINKLKRPKK